MLGGITNENAKNTNNIFSIPANGESSQFENVDKILSINLVVSLNAQSSKDLQRIINDLVKSYTTYSHQH